MVLTARPIRLIVTPKATAGRDLQSRLAADIYRRQLKVRPDSVLGLATGSSPLGLYARLAELAQHGVIDFSRVTTFNLDEYVGVKPEFYDQTYRFFMEKNFFGPLGISPERRHIPDWRASDPYLACRLYEREITAVGGIDLQLLGMGPNGHIAFNEPGTSLSSKTQVVDLEKRTIIANSRCFMRTEEMLFLGLEKDEDPFIKMSGWIEEQRQLFEEIIMPRVPTTAMSMGIASILAARNILMLVSKETKATALRLALTAEPSEQVPASLLRYLPHRAGEAVTIIADLAAATELPHPWNRPGQHIIAG